MYGDCQTENQQNELAAVLHQGGDGDTAEEKGRKTLTLGDCYLQKLSVTLNLKRQLGHICVYQDSLMVIPGGQD